MSIIMNYKRQVFFCALILGSILVTAHKVAGAPRFLNGSGGDTVEYQQEDRAPQTDPQLNVEAIKQQLQHQSFVRKQQQQANYNNGADIVPLYRYQPLIRLQRSLHASQVANQQREQQQQQLLLEDELALRRQLPELIAQARNDKNVERALLKMLIGASLRSAPSSMVQPSSYQYNGRSNDWQDATISGGGDGTTGGEGVFRVPTRLAQMIDDFAGADPSSPSSNDFSGSMVDAQYPMDANVVDKREYTKPCSFNAISCAKPFRDRKL